MTVQPFGGVPVWNCVGSEPRLPTPWANAVCDTTRLKTVTRMAFPTFRDFMFVLLFKGSMRFRIHVLLSGL